MPRLREIQHAFAEGVMGGKPHRLAAELAPAETALRSVGLYRRAIRFNYAQVLKITYPVLVQVMGLRYFETLTRGYLKVHSSTSGDLFPFGRHLPAFLGDLQVVPWLIELARLEWACHEAYHAADSPPLSPEHFHTIAVVDPGCVTVHLQAASRLLRLAFPVHRVWLALQPEASADEDVDLPLPEEESGVVVMRGNGNIQVLALNQPEYRALEALSHGVDVATVERMMAEVHPGFEFSRFVAEALKQSLITGFSIKDFL
ncbi:MAG: putative DNA-binding domain-containing protein [Nitrospirales bacterium]